MKRTIFLAALSSVAIASAAIATPTVQLLVPVRIENVPAEVIRGGLDCRISSAASFDGTRVIGNGHTDFAIEAGRYDGNVGVEAEITGFPSSYDGTLEARSYQCVLTLSFRCASAEGEGMCPSGGGGVPLATSPEPIARLFARDPAQPHVGTIVGTIDRTRATTLPRYQ
jgi:hypothetical protein